MLDIRELTAAEAEHLARGLVLRKAKIQQEFMLLTLTERRMLTEVLREEIDEIDRMIAKLLDAK